jgi:hypothetical protein
MDNTALTEPKTLDPNTRRFEANGVWYNVSDKIATGRMAAYQKLTATYGFGLNTKGFFEMLTNLWHQIQEKQFGSCAVLVYNALEGITKIQENQVQALEICTLFINADGEDCKKWDDSLAQKKIADWSEEGIDSAFFIVQASLCVAGLTDVYKRLSHTTLNEILETSSEGQNQK